MDKNRKLAEKLDLVTTRIARCNYPDYCTDEKDCNSCEELSRTVEEFPNFDTPHNQLELIKLLTNFKRGYSNGYRVTFDHNWVRLEMDFCDMVDDCYDTKTIFGGKDLVTLVINFFEFRGCLNNSSDTRRKVTKDDCYYPDHIDDIAEDHDKIRKKAQTMNWYFNASPKDTEHTMYLSENDFNALADAISNPKPNDALKALLDMPSVLDNEGFFKDSNIE